MRLRLANHLSLALLVASGVGVSGASAVGTTSKTTKPATKTSKPATAKTPAKSPASSANSHRSTRNTKSSKHGRGKERGQMAPTSDRISEIQQALGKDGSFGGTPTGKWDDSTVEAMRKFQAAHGLNPSGKLDALTLQKLGLGSQTAGVAAPIRPVTSSSLTDAPPAVRTP